MGGASLEVPQRCLTETQLPTSKSADLFGVSQKLSSRCLWRGWEGPGGAAGQQPLSWGRGAAGLEEGGRTRSLPRPRSPPQAWPGLRGPAGARPGTSVLPGFASEAAVLTLVCDAAASHRAGSCLAAALGGSRALSLLGPRGLSADLQRGEGQALQHRRVISTVARPCAPLTQRFNAPLNYASEP